MPIDHGHEHFAVADGHRARLSVERRLPLRGAGRRPAAPPSSRCGRYRTGRWATRRGRPGRIAPSRCPCRTPAHVRIAASVARCPRRVSAFAAGARALRPTSFEIEKAGATVHRRIDQTVGGHDAVQASAAHPVVYVLPAVGDVVELDSRLRGRMNRDVALARWQRWWPSV